jgi:hypothetical protein
MSALFLAAHAWLCGYTEMDPPKRSVYGPIESSHSMILKRAALQIIDQADSEMSQVMGIGGAGKVAAISLPRLGWQHRSMTDERQAWVTLHMSACRSRC